MPLLNQLLSLLFSLTGIIFGIILAKIAPEELVLGKRYFKLIKEVLIYGIILFSIFLFIYEKQYWWIIIPIIYLIAYLLKIRKIKLLDQEISNYSSFIILSLVSILFVPESKLQIIIPTLMFLYGFPSGTLLYSDKNKVENGKKV